MRLLRSSLLLGAAASLALVSASGAQAADLPMKVKAPAVQYVKICSLYGAGYYYIPGTDTCLKIGGYMRIDMALGDNGGPFGSYNYNSRQNNGSNYFDTRARAYASFDARTQTEYGTLRSYMRIGAQVTNATGGTAAYSNRMFIQLAGFTWGLTGSIFDHYGATPFDLNIVTSTNGSVGATGVWQWRYTAQLGNGLYVAGAMEEPRRRRGNIAGAGGYGFAGTRYPDFLASIGAREHWGRVGASVALHDDSAWNGNVLNNKVNGMGWAASIGGLFKVPGLPGDTVGFQFAYAKGATRYVSKMNTGGFGVFTTTSGGVDAWGVEDDVVVSATGQMNKTEAYGFEAGYKHAWTRTLNTSLAGGYVHLHYNAAADAVLAGLLGFGAVNADTSVWEIGSSTKWSPVHNFTIGLDVLYSHINNATNNTGLGPNGNPEGSRGSWTGLVRVQRVYWQ